MGVKQVAAFAAALFASAPSLADDVVLQQTMPMTMFYVSIPLGATNAKQQALSYGLALQGMRPSETVLVDTRMFNFAEGLLAGIEAKWVIAGALVVGGGAYLANKDRGRSDSYSDSRNKQQNSPPPPACDPDPCAKK